jgi:catechol 2,3-dioxygenase-like lactoylglutathione lyase family enzyme
MARAKLRHVAISTADPDRTAAWYQAVFGLEVAGRTHSGGYYLTDGDCNLAVLMLRAPDDPTRIRTGVDHFGFVVEDPEATYRLLAAFGAERLPDVPLSNQYFEAKFRGPDGQVIDVGEHGWVGASGLEEGANAPRGAKLRHIAISTPDVERTAVWYQRVFGLVEAGKSPAGVYLTDGETNFAVLRIRSKSDPTRYDVGMHHFGFLVADPEATYRKLEAQGARRLPDVAIDNQYFEVKYEGPDGVTVDIGVHGWVGAKGLVAPTRAGH